MSAEVCRCFDSPCGRGRPSWNAFNRRTTSRSFTIRPFFHCP